MRRITDHERMVAVARERIAGRVVHVLGGGPSLHASLPVVFLDDEAVVGANQGMLHPACDVGLANDGRWIREFGPSVLAVHNGERRPVLFWLRTERAWAPGHPWIVAEPNSAGVWSRDLAGGLVNAMTGLTAIHLADVLGARKIVLHGFDMQAVEGRTHWHDAYAERDAAAPEPGTPGTSWEQTEHFTPPETVYGQALRKFQRYAMDVRAPVFNATPGSALTCWPPLGVPQGAAS